MRRPVEEGNLLDPSTCFEPVPSLTSAAETLAMLGELGDFAKLSLPKREDQPNASLGGASAAAPATASATANEAVSSAAPAKTYSTSNPEYQGALQDSCLIQALLGLLPETRRRGSSRDQGPKARSGFETPRPPSVKVEPKPLGAGRPTGVFKLKNNDR